VKQMINREERGGWKEKTENIKKEMGIAEEDLVGTKTSNARNIKRKTKTYFKKKIEQENKDKSKMKYLMEGRKGEWTPGKREWYMANLTRKQASAIFKARTRMLDVKENFKNKYPGTQGCRMCNEEPETQKHILEDCKGVHADDTTKVTKEDLFRKEGMNTTAEKIIKIQEQIKNVHARLQDD